jgi:hypothetical protein
VTCPLSAPGHADACLSLMLSDGYLSHDPAKEPWRRFIHDDCPFRAGRLAEFYARPRERQELPPDMRSNQSGHPCPICGKPRPQRKDIRADKPCGQCRKHDPAYKEWDRKRAEKRRNAA